MKYVWFILLLNILPLPLIAQQMHVEDFKRYTHPFWQKATYETDKHFALLDILTNEKGFEFFIGSTPVAAIEGEGTLTLSLPNRTTSLLIKHPDYGQLNWKIPGKGVKKKRRYQVYLHTESPDKEYQQEKQWALLTVNPGNAIFYIDSLIHPVQDGMLSLYLNMGKHPCRIESPFYKAISDTLELTDSARLEKHFELEPYYAYLTVRTRLPQAQILLDGQEIGIRTAETGRLKPGRYRLSIRQNGQLYYDRFIDIANSQRKVIDLSETTLTAIPEETLAENRPSEVISAPTQAEDTVPTNTENQQLSPVHIIAFNAETAIWLNREHIGTGEWTGYLAPGFYAVSSQKEELDSRTTFFWVEAGKPVELNLASPLADYGFLNISSNEVNAQIFLNGIPVGETPCVLKHLPADRSYRLQLKKGKKEAESVVYLKGNDIVNVHLKLK